MKIKIGVWICSLISFALLSLSGCKEEYKTTTKINSDGSCERIIIAKVDSSRLFRGGFPVPHDNSWNLEYKTVGQDTKKVFIVNKNFDDVNEINKEYKDKNKVAVEIKFEKKFRWFFSYLTYTEIYRSYNRLNRIPVESYFTKEEYRKIESDDTVYALKKKVDQFMQENLYEEFYHQFAECARNRKDSNLFNLLTAQKKVLKDSLLAGSGDTKSVMKSLKNVFKSEKIEVYEKDIDNILKKINEMLEGMSEINGDYTNEVIMPGIILSTNAPTLEGNKATWKFNQDRFCLIDNVMMIESRVSNIWMIYLTGGIVLVLIILLLVPKLKKNR